jgi:hypothetical protein
LQGLERASIAALPVENRDAARLLADDTESRKVPEPSEPESHGPK